MQRNMFLLWMILVCSFLSTNSRACVLYEDTVTTLHNRGGIGGFFKKLAGNNSVVIAYLGGSITAAAGYRVQTEEFIRTQYPTSKIKTIKAAVGGTGSPLGVFRVDEEVLSYNPDLVFVEFAVNDGSTDSLTVCKAMEGIVRKIKQHNSKTDICFLYTINEPMLKTFSQKKLASSVRYMEQVASHYDITTINLGFDVYDLLQQGKLVFKGPKGNDSTGKIIFTNDGTHPTTEGHKIYTHTIKACFDRLKQYPVADNYRLPAALFENNYQTARPYSPVSHKASDGWKTIGDQPALERFAAALPNLIYTDNPNDSLIIKFSGTFFGIEDIIGPTSSAIRIIIDGKDSLDKQRFDKSCTYYRRSYFYIDSLKDIRHTVIIKPALDNSEKMNILKAIHKEKDSKYSSSTIYIGNILLTGNQSN